MVFAIHGHESAMGAHVSPILNPSPTTLPTSFPHHPTGLSQVNSFGCPASCIELALVIYFTYDNIHASVLFSQIIPPLPSPTESKSLFLHLCLLRCLAYSIVVTIFLNSMHMSYYTVSIFLFLTYFSLYNRLQFLPSH